MKQRDQVWIERLEKLQLENEALRDRNRIQSEEIKRLGTELAQSKIPSPLCDTGSTTKDVEVALMEHLPPCKDKKVASTAMEKLGSILKPSFLPRRVSPATISGPCQPEIIPTSPQSLASVETRVQAFVGHGSVEKQVRYQK